MGAITTILDSFSWFDGLIVGFFLATCVVYAFTRTKAHALYNRLHKVVTLPYHDNGKVIVPRYTKDDVESIVNERDAVERWYAYFTNFSASFPLLGILGTVLSLIPMAADLQDIQSNFFVALTTTFWGLVFSIICKIADAPLSATIESNERTVAELANSYGQCSEESVS